MKSIMKKIYMTPEMRTTVVNYELPLALSVGGNGGFNGSDGDDEEGRVKSIGDETFWEHDWD